MLARHVFPDRDALAGALAEEISGILQAAIAASGRASIALSGGSTPKLLFEQLAHMPVDWEQVTITLVDDRWVAPDSDRSNARLVRESLMSHEAENAQFLPITSHHDTPEEGLVAVEDNLQDLKLPFDVVVLGMGNDGHTASFFPAGDNLAAALNPEGDKLLVSMRAPGAPEPRITFSYPALVSAAHIFLHIEGDEKAATLEDAYGEGQVEDMPVRAFLWQDEIPINLYWCP